MDDFYTKERGAVGQVLRIQRPACERTVISEVAGDFSLPDYQPEIKRLLRVSATAQPPSHYIGGGVAEFSGTVDYCVLYAGNDGQIYCFPTSTEYSFRVPMEAGADFDLNDGLVAYALCEPESIISRVSGPRRMSIKCRLRADVKAHGSYIVEEKRKGTLPSSCGEERLFAERECGVCGYGQSDPFVVSDEVVLEREQPGNADWRADWHADWRIISGDAQVMIGEAKCSNGQVNCRGDVVLKLLLQPEGEGNVPVSLLRKLPFEQSIVADGAQINGEAAVTGCCTELSLGMEEGRVLCEAEIVLSARTQWGQVVSYACDWYATGCQSDCSHSEISVPTPLRCVNANVTQSETRSTEELGIPDGATLVDVAGIATVERVEQERGRYVMSGKCRYSLILSLDGEMSTKEVELPFRYVAEGVQETKKLGYEGQAQVLMVKGRLDGQTLAIDAELGICMRLWDEDSIRVVGTTTVGDCQERRPGEMILCYPSREDTVWSVGKRYGAPLDALISKNRLNDEKRADDPTSLSEVRVIAI